VRAQFEILEKVQEIDLELDQLGRDRETGPKDLAALDQELAKHHIVVQQEIQKTEKLKADLLGKQENYNEETGMIKMKQDRASEIRNQKEYQANMREIEASRMELAILEEDIKIIKNRLTEHEEILKEAQSKFDEIALGIKEKKEKIESRLSSLDTNLEDLQIKRKELSKKCNTNLLGRYDRIRKRSKTGVGLIRVTIPSCPSCFMSIPPQQFNELKRNEKLMVCGSCQLLFYWKDEEPN
jgi:hypothetical protein